MKKTLFILGLLVLIPKFVHASLEITEIMYDPKGANTNHQWVEVYNNGPSPVSVDTAKWRFGDGSLHYMNSKVDFFVPSQSYFILTGDKNTFMADHSGFGGLVIDTSMSLDKDGGSVSMTNDGSIVDSVTYSSSQGGSEDGNSLQKSSGVWIPGIPTPGTILDSLNTNDLNSNNNQTISSSSLGANSSLVSTEEKVKKELTQSKITTEIISPSVVVAGVDFNINQKTIGFKKENIILGRFVWNFGDGMSRESSSESAPFVYRYDYPGEYVLTLSYYQNSFSVEADAKDKIIIRVVPASLVISSVGGMSDPYIELENKSNFELSLSKWLIRGSKNSFVVPEGTIVMPGKKIKISSKITHFNFEDLNNISIYFPSGELVASYPSSKINTYENQTSHISNVSRSKTTTKKEKNNNVINLNDLSASAGDSSRDIKLSWPVVILISLIFLSAGVMYTVYFIKKQKSHDGGLENPIHPRDIDIIE